MRSLEKDRTGIIFCFCTVTDAASGIGLFYPVKIPFYYVRTQPGLYTLTWDKNLIPVSPIGAPLGTAGIIVNVAGYGAGVFDVRVNSNDGSYLAASFALSFHAFDKRN
jgi:hypothetical protein